MWKLQFIWVFKFIKYSHWININIAFNVKNKIVINWWECQILGNDSVCTFDSIKAQVKADFIYVFA